MDSINYQTIQVRFQGTVCYLQFNRPDTNNTINNLLVEECHQVLKLCEEKITIVVLEGLPEVFCFGADFQEMAKVQDGANMHDPGSLYDLWLKLATGPYITISHVRGKANAGGVGFIAASDIVLADQTAQFSLSELLFGLFPACVLPFLTRKIGFQKANYMTLMTHPISVQQAHAWGLVDAYDVQGASLLRKHLLRLKNLSKTAIINYKQYMSSLHDSLFQSKSLAITANMEMFSDIDNLEKILRYVEKGQFPWEG
jgi:polyketide biosynthesis enoyl-CoA hydratase PksH